MNTHEIYVSLEVAKLLKQAGFDWVCPDKYERNIIACRYEDYEKPTLSVAQKWLREVKGVEVYAHVFYDSYNMSDGWDVYVYEVNHITKQIEDWIMSYDVYRSYEEAQESGIKKCLTILLEEKENE